MGSRIVGVMANNIKVGDNIKYFIVNKIEKREYEDRVVYYFYDNSGKVLGYDSFEIVDVYV